jgi:hypothetical protein
MSQTNFRAKDMLGVPKPTPVAKPTVAKPAHSKPAKEAKKEIEVTVEPVAPVVEEPVVVAEVVESAPVEE